MRLERGKRGEAGEAVVSEASFLLCHKRHQLLAECVSFFGSMSLTVDTDDRLRVALAQVHPLVGEVEFHTVDVSNLYIGLRSEVRLHLI